jgi:hypothetical protein
MRAKVIIRLRFRRETVCAFHSLLSAVGGLLTPTALLVGVVGAWRIGDDLDWTSGFFIANGLFSHWQVWIAMALGLQVTAMHLKRLAEEPVSREIR